MKPKNTICLWFNKNAHEAARFYAATVDDYLAFARMLLADGRHRGQSLLTPASVEAMTTNHLTAPQRTGGENDSRPRLPDGRSNTATSPDLTGLLSASHQRQQNEPNNPCDTHQGQHDSGKEDQLVAHTCPPRRDARVSFRR